MQREAQVYNAAAEIGTGFLLILQLLTPARSILLTVVYWCARFCASAHSRCINTRKAVSHAAS